jgi:hypothetical protein
MMRATRTLAAAILVAAVVALTAPAGARAQPGRQDGRWAEQPQQPLVTIPGGGTDLFRALIDKEGVQPVTMREVDRMMGASDDLIVIVIGTVDGWNHDPRHWARQALRAQGAVLIASDSAFQLQSAEVGNNTHLTFSGETLQADQGHVHHVSDCPYVVPVSPNEQRFVPQPPGPVWNLFRGLTHLATNQPTYIEEPVLHRGEFQYPLARLPRSTRTWGRRVPSPLFAVGGDGPARNGRPGFGFVAMADSSVFINQMIMEPGTDNLEFTLRTIEYLQGPGKHRKRCMFFENGRLVEKFDGLRSALAKPQPKIPPEAMPNLGPLFGKNQDKLIDFLNAKADQLQSNDVLHKIAVGPPGSSAERRGFGKWVDGMAVILAIVIARLLLWRTWGARQPTDIPPAPYTGAGAASTGPPGVFERRQKELVRRNNLYEPVRNMMREFFDSVGAPPHPGPRIPPLEIDRSVRKPDSLRQAIRDMWRIAYGPPQPISAQRWFELEPYFERLRRAHADGKWRFVPDDD